MGTTHTDTLRTAYSNDLATARRILAKYRLTVTGTVFARLAMTSAPKAFARFDVATRYTKGAHAAAVTFAAIEEGFLEECADFDTLEQHEDARRGVIATFKSLGATPV